SPLAMLRPVAEEGPETTPAAEVPTRTPAGPAVDEVDVAMPADSSPDAELPPTPDWNPVRTELSWRACGQFEDRNLECAEVMVPVDYGQPGGELLPIAVRRIQANPLEPYHGALLFNPGGPGGEGIDLALALFEGGIFDAIAPGFDIIGFDPRGVASSGEMGCGILPEDMYPGATPSGEPTFGMDEYVAAYKAEGERCEREWGPLFRKLGSNNVVRDMEEIRKALNEPRLNFLGGSYGTRLGALYAHEYPETTGRMVLDAAVHPRASLVQLVRGQLTQVVSLHEQILLGCERGELPCPPESRLVFEQALANARQRGLGQAFVNTWAAQLASVPGVASLLDALAAEAADPGGDWVLNFVGGGGGGEGLVAFFSVNCTDDTFEPPTLDELEALRAEFSELSPLFAEGYLVAAASCAGWPVTRDPVPLPTASDAPALLVIGGVADSRTPYEWSQAMTEALGNATLLTSNHYGHVAVASGSECVIRAVRAYLTSGSLPASGTTCS
ncbi:MAG TPA: alpha/beta hydrolase, partial [Polyangiaceae bacterium]|nr:alpha/beta hydrolase [Polyangiaceae bacterium]